MGFSEIAQLSWEELEKGFRQNGYHDASLALAEYFFLSRGSREKITDLVSKQKFYDRFSLALFVAFHKQTQKELFLIARKFQNHHPTTTNLSPKTMLDVFAEAHAHVGDRMMGDVKQSVSWYVQGTYIWLLSLCTP